MIDFFKHKVSALGTVHRLTIVYHPQTNATERVKLTLRMDFRVYVGTKHRNIGTLLPPHICFAVRTVQHGSTRLSPSILHLYLFI